jgi:hypothetical protein
MELRKVERRLPDGGFAEIKFAELKKGDAFKLYDSIDGDKPIYEDGSHVYIADSDAEPWPPEGNFQVMAHTEGANVESN